MKTITIPPRDPKTGKGGPVKIPGKTFEPGTYVVGGKITQAEADLFCLNGWATSADTDAPAAQEQPTMVTIQPDNIVQETGVTRSG